MIVSKKIISQWLDLDRFSDEELTSAFNNLGFEVEKVSNLVAQNTNIIVGEIKTIAQNAPLTHVQICSVDIGGTTITIVCGAKNISVGQKVIVAQVNSKLASGITIESRTFQGIVSQGMICSLQELGLDLNVLTPNELNGIAELPSNAQVGSHNPLRFLNLDDTIFEIQLTLNRSDCLAMYSIAKELKNYFRLDMLPMRISNLSEPSTKDHQIAINNSVVTALASLKINIDESQNLITNIIHFRTLQLEKIKPKDYFTDLANIVMLELGQPIMVYNGETLKSPAIHTAPKDYLSADLQVYQNDVVLHDGYVPISSIGFTQLDSYQVTSDDQTIIFISCNVQAERMYAQTLRHEANNSLLLARLVKPVVPDFYLIALQRLIFLLSEQEIAFKVLKFTDDYHYQITQHHIKADWTKINQLLGSNYDLRQITNSLKLAGCSIVAVPKADNMLEVTAPIHRNDVNNIHDLAEEVMRVNGYDKLVSVKPQLLVNHYQQSSLTSFLAEMSTYLLGAGYHQVKTYNLTNKKDLLDYNFFHHKAMIELQAPNSQERAVMRFSLVPSLITICETNLAHKQSGLKFFTDDVIYTADDKSDDHYLAFIACGKILPDELQITTDQNHFFLIKGMLESFLEQKLKRDVSDLLSYQPITNSIKINPYLSFDIYAHKIHFATVAALHPTVTRAINFDDQVYFCEINCHRLLAIINETNSSALCYQPWSKYNPLLRDLSLIIDEKIKYHDVKTRILSVKAEYLTMIKLVEVYRDQKLQAENLKSLTLALTFSSNDLQLDEAKIANAFQCIKSALIGAFNAIIRS